MRRVSRRVAVPAVAVLLALVLAACDAGGFSGSKEQTDLRAPIRNYVALGDGFAAAPYVGKTDPARGCLRSENNYPAQVASRLGVQVKDVSCTGAITRAVEHAVKAPAGKGQLPAQLDAIDADTDLVTLTIGISDKDLLLRGFYVCMEWPCEKYRVPAQQIGSDANAVGETTTEIVRAILDKAPDAFVVLVGYPKIPPPEGTCKGLPEMDELQLAGVHALFEQLNTQMQATARETGTTYADLADASEGHDVCSTSSWVRQVDNEHGQKAALLPLAPEQKAAADAVMAALENR